ncbi:MAG: four helix bundle protein [Planctomycetaceae bacterium]|nr:four helix bundle protein [Planctomycetaceae bacterium]
MTRITLEDLQERAQDLALELFRMIRSEPDDEEFELAVEIRKAAQDIARSLTSGMEPRELLDAASGTSARLECLLLLAKDLAFFPQADLGEYRKRAGEIGSAARKLRMRAKNSGS